MIESAVELCYNIAKEVRSTVKNIYKPIISRTLIIVLLLLLMAGDCKEEKNTALLTLALYFFL